MNVCDCQFPGRLKTRRILVRLERSRKVLRDLTHPASAGKIDLAEMQRQVEQVLEARKQAVLPVLERFISLVVERNPGWQITKQQWMTGLLDVELTYSVPHPLGFRLAVTLQSLRLEPETGKISGSAYPCIRWDHKGFQHNRFMPIAALATVPNGLAAVAFYGFVTAHGCLRTMAAPETMPVTRLELLGHDAKAPEAKPDQPHITIGHLWPTLPNLPLWPFWTEAGEGRPRSGPPDKALIQQIVSPDLETLTRWITTGKGDAPPPTIAPTRGTKRKPAGQQTFGALFLMPEMMDDSERVEHFLHRWRENTLASGKSEPPAELLAEFGLPQGFWAIMRLSPEKQREWLLDHQRLRAWPATHGGAFDLSEEQIANLAAVKAWSRLEEQRTHNHGHAKDYMADCARIRLEECVQFGAETWDLIWHNFSDYAKHSPAQELARVIANFAKFRQIAKKAPEAPAFLDLQPGDRIAHFWMGVFGIGQVMAVRPAEGNRWNEGVVKWETDVPWRFNRITDIAWGSSTIYVGPGSGREVA